MPTPLPLRPPRWSIHLLCGLSLLIFLLAMGIWVRSYFVQEIVSRLQSLGTGQQFHYSGICCARGYLVGWRTVMAKQVLWPDLGKVKWDYEQQPPIPVSAYYQSHTAMKGYLGCGLRTRDIEKPAQLV